VTADELDALAAIAADVRIAFAKAQTAALSWDIADCPDWWRPAPRRR